MKRIIWIISEGSPGHVSQSVGLTDALVKRISASVFQFECHLRLGGLARSLIRHVWMGKRGRALPLFALGMKISTNEMKPDLIVASGGKGVFTARSLAVKYQVPFIFLGERKPYPPTWFHTVFTPSAHETASCDVRMDVIPTKVSPQGVADAAAAWLEKPAGRLWTMLVGGKSRSHRYEDSDWQQLADGMNALSRREGIRWLVTTSRRTGLETENKLRSCLAPYAVADAVWWCDSPEKKLTAYLGAAERIWVTQDSVSMVTEATATAKPVIIVSPKTLNFPSTSFMPGYLNNLELLGLITRMPISRMLDDLIPAPAIPTRPIRTTDALAAIACQRLGWT